MAEKESTICVTVRLFAALKELAGKDPLQLRFVAGTSCDAALHYLGSRYAEAWPLLRRSLVALNGRYADRDDILSDNDEMAILPPVSGG